MTKQEAIRILEKFAAGSATPGEEKAFQEWLDELDDNAFGALLDRYRVILDQYPRQERADPAILNKIEKRLTAYEHRHAGRIPKMIPRSVRAAAAVIVLLIAAGGLFYTHYTTQHKQADRETDSRPGNDIAPGGNKAVLILDDGAEIVLEKAENGILLNQGTTIANKTADGQIEYSISGASQSDPGALPAHHTIRTPAGGEYQVVLPDGSKAWLNASSSLRYPTAFTGTERQVELEGEAYFEVAPTGQTFQVLSGQTTVEVLGTRFNIMAYDNEDATAVTLLEGSVKVSGLQAADRNGRPAVLLEPGQQAQINHSGEAGIHVTGQVDIEQITAWKEGYFLFAGEELESIMRKIARWYDVEVVYQGDFEELYFGGAVSRSKQVSEVLKIMELTGNVHFEIEGRRITVMP